MRDTPVGRGSLGRHVCCGHSQPCIRSCSVQNADDAGATKAAFLLDMRSHGTSSLLGPGMAAWQGPALLAYNNTVFSPGRYGSISDNSVGATQRHMFR